MAGAVFLLAFAIYNANLRVVGPPDSYSARYVPFSIWKAGRLDLEPVIDAALQRTNYAYWMYPMRDGRRASLFPIVTPVVITPLYAPAAAYLQWRDWRQEELERVALIMDKVSASILASAAAALMFLVFRRRLSLRDSMLLTIVFAFGTSTWSTSSQSLWLHAMAELCGALALWALTLDCTPKRALVAGVAIALMVANRPTDIFLAAPLGIYGIVWAGRRLPWLVLGGVVAGSPFLAYNYRYFHHPLGAWGLTFGAVPEYFAHSIKGGIAGLLFSPGRGLFVFSPVLLFLPRHIDRVFRERQQRLLAVALMIGIAVQIVFYARADWRGGASYGPRYLVDTLPFLVWLMIPIIAAFKPGRRLAFIALLLFSIAVQFIGAFQFQSVSYFLQYPRGEFPFDARPFWAIDLTQYLIEAKQPIAPPVILWTFRVLGDPPPQEMLQKPPAGIWKPLPRCTLINTRGADAPAFKDGENWRMFAVPGRCGLPATPISVTGFVTVSATQPGNVFFAPHNGGPWQKVAAGPSPHVAGPMTVPLWDLNRSLRIFTALERRGDAHVQFDVVGYHTYEIFAPLTDAAFKVTWQGHTMPATVRAGSTTQVQVTFTNASAEVWPNRLVDPTQSNPTNPVRLGNAWYAAGAPLSNKPLGRTDLSAALQPGQTVTLTVPITAPKEPGRYTLVFSLVQELVAWFDDKGATRLEIPVTVN